MKYLGIRLDSQLTFKIMSLLEVKKLSKLLGLQKFTRQDLNLENRLFHYETIVEPVMSNALLVYGSTNSNNLHTVFLLQKKVIRVIFGKLLFAHSCGLFERSSIQTVHELYASALKKFFFGKLQFIHLLNDSKVHAVNFIISSQTKIFQKTVQKFSVEHRAIKMINNHKKSGAW